MENKKVNKKVKICLAVTTISVLGIFLCILSAKNVDGMLDLHEVMAPAMCFALVGCIATIFGNVFLGQLDS